MEQFIDQDDFSFTRDTSYVGMIADNSPFNFISCTVEKSGLKFGMPAFGGIEDNNSIPFDGKSLYFQGVVRRYFKQFGTTIGASETRAFQPPATIQVVDFGIIWVCASNTIKAGDPATITPAGLWAGGNIAGNYIVDGATYISSGDKDQKVKLKLTGGKSLTLIAAPATVNTQIQQEKKGANNEQ